MQRLATSVKLKAGRERLPESSIPAEHHMSNDSQMPHGTSQVSELLIFYWSLCDDLLPPAASACIPAKARSKRMVRTPLLVIQRQAPARQSERQTVRTCRFICCATSIDSIGLVLGDTVEESIATSSLCRTMCHCIVMTLWPA